MSKITVNNPILPNPIGNVILNKPCEINKNSIGYSLLKNLASYRNSSIHANSLGFASNHKIPKINFLHNQKKENSKNNSSKLDSIKDLSIKDPFITNKKILLEKIPSRQFIDKLSDLSSFLEKEKDELKYLLSQHEKPITAELSSLVKSISHQLNTVLPPNEAPSFQVIRSNSPLLAEVDLMIDRARQNLPPTIPYNPEEWGSAVDFVKRTYGQYLSSCGAETDFLYQDQLREIHPDKMKVTLLKRRIKSEQEKANPDTQKITKFKAEITVLEEQYGTKEWGYDVVKALQNYYQNNKTSSIRELLKGKNDRLEQEREVLRSTGAGKKAQQSASRLTYLNYTK